MGVNSQKISKHIHVACAIIENNRSVLAAQRSATMSLPLKWEFPGGKILAKESPEECIHREIYEELDVEISLVKSLPKSTHDYPTITVTLYPFVCSIIAGEIKLYEHKAVRWLHPDELNMLDWAEADLPVLSTYRQLMST